MYSAGFFFSLILPLLFAAFICSAEPEMQDCHPSCGTLANISYPFYLKQSPRAGCPGRKPPFELTCERNRAISYVKARPYYVMNITYDYDGQGLMWLIDSALQIDNCSSLLSYNSSSLPTGYSYFTKELQMASFRRVVYVNCPVPVKDPAYVPAAPCSQSSSPPLHPSYLYAILSTSMSIHRLDVTL